jgi:hypothetical protein
MLRKLRDGVESAAAFVSAVGESDGSAGFDDTLAAQLDQVDERLQNQLKELKTFIGGMNSMCSAALRMTERLKQAASDGITMQVA